MKYLNTYFTAEGIKVFYIALALSIIYVSPIIFADQYYSDDLSRSIYGYARWGYDGRPLADLVMLVLSFGEPLLDLSPAPLILGLVCICAALSIYASKVMPDSGVKEKVALSILFICNPFLLDNMSYKYDALTMLLSASLIILCFTYGRSLKSSLISIILVIASLSLYQASITMFVSLSVIEAIMSFCRSDKSTINTYKDILLRAMQFLLAYLAYSLFIASMFAKGSHNEKHSELIFGGGDPLNVFLDNINAFTALIGLYVSSVPRFVVVIFLISSIISVILICNKIAKNGKSMILGKVIPILLVLSSPFLLYFFSFIHLAMLKNTIIAGRVLIPFGCIFIVYAVFISEVKWLKLASFILIVFSFSLSFAYGNTMKAQKRYDDYIASSMMTDITYLGREVKSMSVFGIIAKSKQLKLANEKYPIIEKLVPLYINNNSGWGGTMLLHYGLKLRYEPLKNEHKKLLCHMKPEIVRPDYSVYVLGNKAIFKQNGFGC
ncbi:glucosyltransferase domain-containing protein [Enterobacter oligotrophicus]|uniref:glucosyltransferase domain-containing protein n=1 Tax=Enterobacter oligotrophicus TaxID=2478464 RepID=UPI0028AF70DE|nr:glucosyltransferase domain-containing protein [Enterobacter oligotrophicus]